MPFDAGTIVARLELDESAFDRSLDKAREKADKISREPIKLKTTEVFDQESTSKARKTFADMDNQLSRDAVSRMRSGNGSVLGTLMSVITPRQLPGAPSAQQSASQGILGRLFGGGSGSGGSGFGGGGSSGGGNQGLGTGLFKGIGPGILGLGTRASLITGGLGVAGSLLPSLLGGLGGLGVAGAGLGVASLGAKELIGTQQKPGQLYAPAQQALKQLEGAFKDAAQPLVAPLKQAFAELPGLLKTLGPAMKDVFAGAATLIQPTVSALAGLAKTILPLLGQAFKAASPLIGPLITGIGKLVSGILPGLITLLKASQPAVAALSSVFSSLGGGIGKMLSDLAPAVRASSVVLQALGKVLGGIFPIIGSLASTLAKTLAPIFVQLASVIRALEPTLQIVGKVFASLAGAILGDLVSAFSALAKLIIQIQPAIQIFAKALGQTFNVLENSGVFAVLGDALESIVPILGKLINSLVGALAPVLPIIIGLVSKLSTIFVDLLAAGLTVILSALVSLINFIHPLIPALALLTAAWVAFDIATSTNPFGAAVLGIIALVGAIKLLADHWSVVWNGIKSVFSDVVGYLKDGLNGLKGAWDTVWGDVKTIAFDAWNFINNGFGKYLLPLLGPAGTIAFAALELYKNWHTIIADIKNDADDLWQHLVSWGDNIKNLFTNTIPGWWNSFVNFTKNDLITPFEDGFNALWTKIQGWGTDIKNLFTQTIPNDFKTAVSAIGKAWSDIENVVKAPVNFVITKVIDGLISAFDWISSKVGGPTIAKLPGLAAGGLIPGYGGGDQLLALLERGETVIDKDRSKVLAPLFSAMGIPGYSGGGIIGSITGAIGKALDVGKILAALATGNTTALTNAMYSLMGSNAHSVGGATGDLAKVLTDVPKTLIGDAIKSLINTVSSSGGSGGGYAGPGGGAPAANAALARKLEPAWATGINWTDWNNVAMRESGWSQYADNAASGAYGIPQSLPYTKMPKAAWPASAGGSSNPTAQITWMISYIKGKYGSPVGAWAHELSAGWYDQGGWLGPGMSLMANGTGGREAVLTPSQSDAFTALARAASGGGSDLGSKLDRIGDLMATLIGVNRNAPVAVANTIGGALSSSAHQARMRNRWRTV